MLDLVVEGGNHVGLLQETGGRLRRRRRADHFASNEKTAMDDRRGGRIRCRRDHPRLGEDADALAIGGIHGHEIRRARAGESEAVHVGHGLVDEDLG
jgi:hypothetical protein